MLLEGQFITAGRRRIHRNDMHLCPNAYILFRVLHVNPGPAIAPPPALRRRRPLRAEPVVFAVLLTMLTLGINLSGVPSASEQADRQPAPAQVASSH